MLAEARGPVSSPACDRLRDAKSLFVCGQIADPLAVHAPNAACAPRGTNIAGLSSICPPPARESDENTTLSWPAAMVSRLHAVPPRASPLQAEKSRTHNQASANSGGSATRSSLGNSDRNVVGVYDAHIQSDAARREEAYRYCAAVENAKFTDSIAQSAKLSASLGMQRRIMSLEAQKLVRAETLRREMRETTATGRLNLENRVELDSVVRSAPFVYPVLDKKRDSAQFALSLLKSNFAGELLNPTRGLVSSLQAQIPTPQSAEPQQGAVDEKRHKRYKKVDKEKTIGTCDHKSTLNTNRFVAPVVKEPSVMHYIPSDGSSSATPRRSFQSTCSGSLTDSNSPDALSVEDTRAMELLTTVRALRSQTEDLLVVFLHAAGAWGCWDDAEDKCGMRSLFLSPKMTMQVSQEETARNARLMRMRAVEKGHTSNGATDTAHMRLKPFQRVLPPPPPVAVQMELFHRQQRQCCAVSCERELETEKSEPCDTQESQETERTANFVGISWRSCVRQMLLPQRGDNVSGSELPTRVEQDAYLDELLAMLKKAKMPLVNACDIKEETPIEEANAPTRAEAQTGTSPAIGEPLRRTKKKRLGAKTKASKARDEHKKEEMKASEANKEKNSTTAALHTFHSAVPLCTSVPPHEDGDDNVSEEDHLENFSHASTFSIPSTSSVSHSRVQLEEQAIEEPGTVNDLPLRLSESPFLPSKRPLQRDRASVDTVVQPVFHAEHTCKAKMRGSKGVKGFAKRMGTLFLRKFLCGRYGSVAENNKEKRLK